MDFYYFQESRLSLKIIDEDILYNMLFQIDNNLEKIKQDIITITETNEIDIKYRWSPISSDIKSNKQIKIYFYWTSDISFDCVRDCIKTRFGERILFSTNRGSINCPRNIDVTMVCMSNKNECVKSCTSMKYGLINLIDDHCKQCVSLKTSNTNYLEEFGDFDYILIPQKSLIILDDDDVYTVDADYFRPPTVQIVTQRYNAIKIILNNLFCADVASIILLYYGCFQLEIKQCIFYDWCAKIGRYNDDIVQYSQSKPYVSGFEYVHQPILKLIDLPQPDSGYLYLTSSNTDYDDEIFDNDWETVPKIGKCKSIYLIEFTSSISERKSSSLNISTKKMIDL